MKTLALILTLFALLPAAEAAAEAKRPNVVFFLADDLGQRDLGCYGSTFYETPNLDRLAKDGARFTVAYAACSVCSPTRVSLLTGQWPQRTGVTDHIGAPTTPAQHQVAARALRGSPRAQCTHAGKGDEGGGLRDVLRGQVAPRPRGLVAGESGLRHQYGRRGQGRPVWREEILFALRQSAPDRRPAGRASENSKQP